MQQKEESLQAHVYFLQKLNLIVPTRSHIVSILGQVFKIKTNVHGKAVAERQQ